MKGHLTAFETRADTGTCTGLLTFVSFTGGLAVAGAFTTTDTLTALFGTWARFDVLDLHKKMKLEWNASIN